MLLAQRRAASPYHLSHLLRAWSSSLLNTRQIHNSSLESPQPSEGPLQAPTIADVQTNFVNNAAEAAEQLSQSLSPAQRTFLAAALTRHSENRETDERYVQELFEAADIDGDKGALNKDEFQQALKLHRALDGSNIRTPPDLRALKMVFIAAAIPFIGFGFLDNFIMLVAGEEIDELFGARFGLSTLASAGLGNLVADVIGVGAANGIESGVKKLPYIREFKLSKHQSVMPSVKMTKAVGATVGVMVGCILGLAPLFWSGTFFVPGRT